MIKNDGGLTAFQKNKAYRNEEWKNQMGYNHWKDHCIGPKKGDKVQMNRIINKIEKKWLKYEK